MLIRRAVVSDVEALTALALKSKAHWGYTPAQLESFRPVLEQSAQSVLSRPVFIAEIDAGIAGFYSLAAGDGDAAWQLDDLWVAPDFMGKGVGRALVLHAQATAAAGGATSIQIDADPNAAPFYLACGATPTGEVAAPIEGQPDRVRPQFVLALAHCNALR